MGNVGELARYVIQVDGSSPTTVLHTIPDHPNGNNGWYTSKVTLSFAASDEESGVNYTMYRIDGGAWQVYKHPFILRDGVHTIEYYSVDVIGNKENVKEKEIKVDSSAPSLEIIEPINYLYIFNRKILPLRANISIILGKITITAYANDSLSGLNKTNVYIDGEKVKESNQSKINYTIDNPMIGFHTIKIVAIDSAGNEETGEIKTIILIIGLLRTSSE